MDNGEYQIDVILTGGSGKANIISPTTLTVTDEGMSAEIEWSSPNYDYMQIDGKEYFPVNDGGNSRFIVDVPALDEEIPVTAETTAMSKPHMIEYTLYFDSASVHETAGADNSAAFIWCGVGAAAVLAAAAAYFVKRRKNAEKQN